MVVKERRVNKEVGLGTLLPTRILDIHRIPQTLTSDFSDDRFNGFSGSCSATNLPVASETLYNATIAWKN